MSFKLLLGALAACALAGAASGAVVITPFLGGPFSDLNPDGTLPATTVVSGDTYDFTFTLVPPLSGESATQVEAVADLRKLHTSELIKYQVYEGVPTTSDPEAGTLLATSDETLSPSVFLDLKPGSYYVNILPSDIAVSGEVVSGSFTTTAVPEPASWAMMLMGAGMSGAILRAARRRRLAAA